MKYMWSKGNELDICGNLSLLRLDWWQEQKIDDIKLLKEYTQIKDSTIAKYFYLCLELQFLLLNHFFSIVYESFKPVSSTKGVLESDEK